MKKKNILNLLGIITFIAIIGLQVASCATVKNTNGIISFDIDSELQSTWNGTEDFLNIELSFDENSVKGSSDIASEINLILSEMVKKGDAKFIAENGSMRFTGNFDGTNMGRIPRWFTYTITDDTLTIKDLPRQSNNNTTPDLFIGIKQ